MKSVCSLVILFCVLCIYTAPVSAQPSMSEQAQRHFDRGMVAVELAETRIDLEIAAGEFEEAARLAPDWPEAYYNLGMVQEKAGKYREAASSLRRYLQLAPDSPDAAVVRSLANKAEFKAEQVITDEDVLDIFGSVGDSNIWQLKGTTPDSSPDPGSLRGMRIVGKKGQQIIISYLNRTGDIRTIFVTPQGKTLSFETLYSLCPPSVQKDECPDVSSYRLEIVSKRHVKMSRTRFLPEIKPYIAAEVKNNAYEFVRK